VDRGSDHCGCNHSRRGDCRRGRNRVVTAAAVIAATVDVDVAVHINVDISIRIDVDVAVGVDVRVAVDTRVTIYARARCAKAVVLDEAKRTASETGVYPNRTGPPRADRCRTSSPACPLARQSSGGAGTVA